MANCETCMKYNHCRKFDNILYCGEYESIKDLRLPCSVEDVVYVLYEEDRTIEEKRILSVEITISKEDISMQFNCNRGYKFLDEDIGVTVFLSREESKQALKKYENNS